MKEKCLIYGCPRNQEPEKTVDFDIDGTTLTTKVCEFHYTMFRDIPADHYNVGMSFNGYVEVRLVPAVPATEPTPEEE